MHLGAAEVFGGDFLAGGRLHQRRAAEEDRRLVAHHDRFVRHGRHIGAAGGAGAHDAGDLRNAGADMLAWLKKMRPKCSRSGTPRPGSAGWRRRNRPGRRRADCSARDLLRAQMLLHRQRIVGAALHGGVVDDDHHLAALDAADAGDHAGGRCRRRTCPRRRTGRSRGRASRVEQLRQPLARQQLAARHMALARFLRAAALDGRRLGGNVVATSARMRSALARKASEAVEIWDWMTGMRTP
jgi:hypothetical protein